MNNFSGSGDGRIVHFAAQNGFQSHGIELNPWLVIYSKIKSWRLGLKSSATFARADLWKHDFAQYDQVVIFGVEQMVNSFKQAGPLWTDSELDADFKSGIIVFVSLISRSSATLKDFGL